jgi:hypothetical protein
LSYWKYMRELDAYVFLPMFVLSCVIHKHR